MLKESYFFLNRFLDFFSKKKLKFPDKIRWYQIYRNLREKLDCREIAKIRSKFVNGRNFSPTSKKNGTITFWHHFEISVKAVDKFQKT